MFKSLKVRTSVDKAFSPFFLLLGLLFYCFILIFLFGSDSAHSSPFVVDNYAQIDSPHSVGDLEFAEISGFREYEGEYKELNTEALSSYDSDAGEVLGVRASGACGSILETKDPQLVCFSDDVAGEIVIEYEGGPLDIKLQQIYAPSALFTGALGANDNLGQIFNNRGIISFSNSNEMIHPLSYLRQQPPLQSYVEDEGYERDSAEGSKIFGDSVFDHEPYNINASVADSEPFEVTVAVSDGDRSLCPDVINDGRFTAKKTNDWGGNFAQGLTPPGLIDFSKKRDFPQVCEEAPQDIIHLDSRNSFLLCDTDFLSLWWERLRVFFSDRTICRTSEDGACVEEEVRREFRFTGVLIDSPFGSSNACNEESCGIRALDAGMSLSSTPVEIGDYHPANITDEDLKEDYILHDPAFVTTPCKILINGKSYTTRCYWDLAAWKNLFNLEERTIYPGFKDEFGRRLTFRQYWENIETQLKSIIYD